MPRLARVSAPDTVFHVINRANGRVQIFSSDDEYRHFGSLLKEGVDLFDMRILAYCIMPNHWHLALYPRRGEDMSAFMHWVTTTHVRQRRTKTQSIGYGHLYQGAYKSFPVETEVYARHLILYIEQNPLRAKLVKNAVEWQWSSLYRREKGTAKEKTLLAELPIVLPRNYLELVNTFLPEEKLENIRRSLQKGAPYGSDAWVARTAKQYGLESTLREPGRPKKVIT